MYKLYGNITMGWEVWIRASESTARKYPYRKVPHVLKEV
jgi:hypothetical protein